MERTQQPSGRPGIGWARHTFASLWVPNYRLYFFGQLISLVGLWVQNAALSWLVYDLTASTTMLGFIAAAETLPVVILSTWAGVLADRFSKRRILVVTQSFEAVLALSLALLVLTDSVEVWHLVVLALLLGIDTGLEMPAHHSFIIEMVGKEKLLNAIGLNSTIWDTARTVGPAVAGLVIAAWGVGVCFLANAISFAAFLLALGAMKLGPRPVTDTTRGSNWQQALAGFEAVRRSSTVRRSLMVTSLFAVFGGAHLVLMPAIAADSFALRAHGYGALMAAAGLGSLVGALTVASLGQRRHRRRLVGVFMVLFATTSVLFAQTSSFVLALAMLAPMGLASTVIYSTTNALIQESVSDRVRGRVMGVYTLIWGIVTPLGGFLAGGLAEHLGCRLTVTLCAGVVGVGGAALAALRPLDSGEGPVQS